MDDEQGRILAFPQAPARAKPGDEAAGRGRIELRHLRSFVAVAEDLNFGRAAARLYLSQPALSRQISALEKLVGCELLRRSTHRVELTLAGEALLDRARRVLADVDEAVSTAQSVGGELVARVAWLWEPVVDAGSAEHELQELRAAYEGLHAQFSPPPELDVLPVNANGVAAFTLMARPDQPVTILCLHGGGYALGSAYGYRPIAGALAAAAESGALVVEYRLAPEHPFPAALDDSLRAYGVDVRLELYPVDTHVFQLFWSFLPEAVDAIGQAGEFVQEQRAPAAAERRDAS